MDIGIILSAVGLRSIAAIGGKGPVHTNAKLGSCASAGSFRDFDGGGDLVIDVRGTGSALVHPQRSRSTNWRVTNDQRLDLNKLNYQRCGISSSHERTARTIALMPKGCTSGRRAKTRLSRYNVVCARRRDSEVCAAIVPRVDVAPGSVHADAGYWLTEGSAHNHN